MTKDLLLSHVSGSVASLYILSQHVANLPPASVYDASYVAEQDHPEAGVPVLLSQHPDTAIFLRTG